VIFSARGSLWGQWDLHFHTPSSYDYHDKSVTNADLVDGLKKAGIVAVAITDHHQMDVPRIRELQRLAGADLTVFPGIEFRSELGGKDKVHFIGIFPEDCNLEDVWTKLCGQLLLTPEDITKRGGDEGVYVDLKDASTIIHGLGGIVTSHAGTKTNSIESIGNKETFKQVLKTDLMRDFVDLYELGKPTDRKAYEETVFPEVGVKRPLILCSDNHNINSYSRKASCWIKGDRTFRTFQQMKSDVSRAWIGDTPPEITRVLSNKTKYIDSVFFEKNADSVLNEDWFSGVVPLNTGLVAVIGNKGSGKTALAETIGLLGNCELSKHFSFLEERHFRKGRHSKAKEFVAKILWVNGHESTASLAQDVDSTKPAEVAYIPQSYLESICNEVDTIEGSQFDAELKSVIFSHVSPDKQLGAATLDELLNFMTEPIIARMGILRGELSVINRSIVSLMEQDSSDSRQYLLNLKDSKERELATHEANKPTLLPLPDADGEKQDEIEALRIAINNLVGRQAELTHVIREAQAVAKVASSQAASATRVTQIVDNFRTTFDLFLSSLAADCAIVGIDPTALVQIHIDTTPVTDAALAARTSLETQQFAIAEAITETATLRIEIAALSEQLDAPNAAYQRSLEQMEAWEAQRAEIVGSDTSPNSLADLQAKIAALTTLPERLKEQTDARDTKTGEIFDQLNLLVSAYSDLYEPVQSFITKHSLAKELFHLDFTATIVSGGLDKVFLDKINQGRRGSFSGQDEGRRVLQQLQSTADVSSKAGTLSFTKDLLDRCNADFRSSAKPKTVLGDQLKNTVKVEDILDGIFALEYLVPKYQLRWSGKDLVELSPGERGTLLLIFYLLIDKRDCPLVIDQPEENLDNETVVEVLVPCMREARSRRQIIMVTHNPNLAVVCDADQIVHCHIDKKAKNKVTYTTGSLENPETNKFTVTVLEGTRRAFDHRGAKYQDEQMT
jgi:ABC-type lipoprotein export system ATPase subunit